MKREGSVHQACVKDRDTLRELELLGETQSTSVGGSVRRGQASGKVG